MPGTGEEATPSGERTPLISRSQSRENVLNNDRSRHNSSVASSPPQYDVDNGSSVAISIDPTTTYHTGDNKYTNKLIFNEQNGNKPNSKESYGTLGRSLSRRTDSRGELTSSLKSTTSRMSREASRLYMSFDQSEERITLTWDDIDVYAPPAEGKFRCPCLSKPVESDPKYKHILRNVSGVAKPGTLLAILGASGAGKTTLLNVLTYRNRGNLLVQGSVKVNGGNIGSGMASLSAYVQQEDIFIGTLKVKEHLWFQSQLRIDKYVPQSIRKKRVDAVMQEMGLGKCADTYIGIPGKLKGISGGEKKRLAVASEVLTNPPLMFLDEPTSGLDSFMAQSIVITLKNMAAKGRTILCTIHQPSSETFELFDRVLLVANGRTAYLGPADKALEFFKSCGHPSPRNYNPADHYIHTLAMWPGREEKCREQIENICEEYEKSIHREDVRVTTNTVCNRDDGVEYDEIAFADQSPYKASICLQFKALLWRSWLTCSREPGAFRTRALQAVILATVFGLVYWQQPLTQRGVENINGAMFLMQTQMTFGFVFVVVMTFPAEFPIFLREHHDGMYRVFVYFLSKMIAEFPQFLLIPIMFTTIMHWAVGLYPTPEAFLINVAVAILVCNCSTSFGYLLSSSSSNVTKVLALGPIFIVPCMMIGGFYIKPDTIPDYFLWLKYLSWYTYANEIMVVTQWKDVANISCVRTESSWNFSVTSQYVSTDIEKCIDTGAKVIRDAGYTQDNVWFDFTMMVVLIIGFRLLAFILLYIRSRNKFSMSKGKKA